MKKVNYSKRGFDDAKAGRELRDELCSVGGGLSCEGRPKRSFMAVMKSFDMYQEGWMCGMEALRKEAMEDFSEERQRMIEDEAERVEKKIDAAKKK
jgi:hypothetical protein